VGAVDVREEVGGGERRGNEFEGVLIGIIKDLERPPSEVL